VLTDPFGRPITYLRISLTDRCNLRCVYCMPTGGLKWLPRKEILSNNEIVQVVQTAAALGINKIRLTGGEPLVRPGIVELVRAIAAIPSIQDISLTTNGILLEKLVRPLARAGLKRVNVSLDTLKPDRYQTITRFGSFAKVWDGLLAAEQAGLSPIKLNAVIIRGFNDDELPDLAQLSLEHPWDIRFIEVMPIGNAQDWGRGFLAPQERFVSVHEMRTRLVNFTLQPAETPTVSGPARTFRIPGAAGTVGFISPLGEHFCHSCNRLRLTADGNLRACLVVPFEIPLRSALRKSQPLEGFFLQAVVNKPQQHNLHAAMPAVIGRGMSQIGG
jgi:cyclic pyranopterin phosphate synthase